MSRGKREIIRIFSGFLYPGASAKRGNEVINKQDPKELELMVPAPPEVADKIGLDECEFPVEKKMTRYPAGNKPEERVFS